MIRIDARKLTTKEKSHAYLKEKLSFPDYYGSNLDALHDCLTEITEPIQVYHVEKAGEYYEKLAPVFEDAGITEMYGKY